MARTLSDTTIELLDGLNPLFIGDPDIQGTLAACDGELALVEGKMNDVQEGITGAGKYLESWEKLFGLANVGTDAERISAVESSFRQIGSSSSGGAWELRLSEIAPSSSYEEDLILDYTIRVSIPYSSGGVKAGQTERLLRQLTPAHLDIIVSYDVGFIVGESNLGEEAL